MDRRNCNTHTFICELCWSKNKTNRKCISRGSYLIGLRPRWIDQSAWCNSNGSGYTCSYRCESLCDCESVMLGLAKCHFRRQRSAKYQITLDRDRGASELQRSQLQIDRQSIQPINQTGIGHDSAFDGYIIGEQSLTLVSSFEAMMPDLHSSLEMQSWFAWRLLWRFPSVSCMVINQFWNRDCKFKKTNKQITSKNKQQTIETIPNKKKFKCK